jgi:hypothetical protein
MKIAQSSTPRYVSFKADNSLTLVQPYQLMITFTLKGAITLTQDQTALRI